MRVLRGRHDDYAGPPVRTVTLRALALPLTEIAPLLEPAGRLLVFGGTPRLAGPFALEDAGPEAGDTRVFRRLAGGVSRGTPSGAHAGVSRGTSRSGKPPGE